MERNVVRLGKDFATHKVTGEREVLDGATTITYLATMYGTDDNQIVSWLNMGSESNPIIMFTDSFYAWEDK